MNRITKEQQQEMVKHQLTAMQLAIYENLLRAQETYPNLSKRQYRLFLSIFEQVKKNAPSIKYHGKTRNNSN
jgi:hypothetical protein